MAKPQSSPQNKGKMQHSKRPSGPGVEKPQFKKGFRKPFKKGFNAQDGDRRKAKNQYTKRKKHKPNFKQRRKLKAVRDGTTNVEAEGASQSKKGTKPSPQKRKRDDESEPSQTVADNVASNDHGNAEKNVLSEKKQKMLANKNKQVQDKQVQKQPAKNKNVTAHAPTTTVKQVEISHPITSDDQSVEGGKLASLKSKLLRVKGVVLSSQKETKPVASSTKLEPLAAEQETSKPQKDVLPAKVAAAGPVSSNWASLSKQIKKEKKQAKKAAKTKTPAGAGETASSGAHAPSADLPRGRSSSGDEPGRILPSMDDLSSFAAPLAIDCEMVGVGEDGKRSMLARVSIVDVHGAVVLDTYVAPVERVTDYRTAVSGIRPGCLKHAPSFKEIQELVSRITRDKVLVGHGLRNDLQALLLSHSRQLLRDTAAYKPYMRMAGAVRRPRRLRDLAKEVLGLDIQGAEHSSVEDARAALLLYKRAAAAWDREMQHRVAAKGKKKAPAAASASAAAK